MFPKAEGSRERKLAVERQGEAKGAAPPEHNFSPPERKEAGDGLQGGLVPAAANKPDSERGYRKQPMSVISKRIAIHIRIFAAKITLQRLHGMDATQAAL